MPDQERPQSRSIHEIHQAVSVHAKQIEDACIDKDCIEDLRCYLTTQSQATLDNASSARARAAELLHVDIEVEPIVYHRGRYTADLTFYYRIVGEASNGRSRPAPLEGLAVFSKRVVLRGGETCAKVFTSSDNRVRADRLYACDKPECVVEVVDPMILAAKVLEQGANPLPGPVVVIPQAIEDLFDDPLVIEGEGKRMLVTLGQFSTVRLERSAQLLLPSFDGYFPDKECCDDPGSPEEPCELFARVEFPKDVFYPQRGCGCPVNSNPRPRG